MPAPPVRVAERTRTTTRPLEHLQPADPLARTADPLARTGGPLARTGGPLAHSLNPFARSPLVVDPLARNPLERRLGRDPFRPRDRRPGKHTVRRIHLLPPFAHVPRISTRFVLPAAELFYAFEEPSGARTFVPGDGWDFDEVGVYNAQASGCDECGCGEESGEAHAHLLYAVRLEAGDPPWKVVELGDGYWDDKCDAMWESFIRPPLVQLREQFLDDPAVAFTDRWLGGMLAKQALSRGGYDLPEGFWTGEDLVRETLSAIEKDPGIRNALADLVVLEHPELLGEDVANQIHLLLSAAENIDCYLGHPDDTQFFMFDPQMFPGAVDCSDLTGHMISVRARYISTFDIEDPPPGLIAWREIDMVRCDEEWNPLVEMPGATPLPGL